MSRDIKIEAYDINSSSESSVEISSIGVNSDLIFTWTGDVNTDWTEAENWDLNHIPVLNSSVVIPDMDGDIIITYSSNEELILNSLSSIEDLVFSSGTIEVTGDSNVYNFTLANGVTFAQSESSTLTLNGEFESFDAFSLNGIIAGQGNIVGDLTL